MGTSIIIDEGCGTQQWFYDSAVYNSGAGHRKQNTLFSGSADSIPTSLGQEDHVSMGSISGRKLEMVLENLEYILAIELMTACQAINSDVLCGVVQSRTCPRIRAATGEFANEDRIFADDIRKIKTMIKHSALSGSRLFASAQGNELNKNYEDFYLN